MNGFTGQLDALKECGEVARGFPVFRLFSEDEASQSDGVEVTRHLGRSSGAGLGLKFADLNRETNKNKTNKDTNEQPMDPQSSAPSHPPPPHRHSETKGTTSEEEEEDHHSTSGSLLEISVRIV